MRKKDAQINALSKSQQSHSVRLADKYGKRASVFGLPAGKVIGSFWGACVGGAKDIFETFVKETFRKQN